MLILILPWGRGDSDRFRSSRTCCDPPDKVSARNTEDVNSACCRLRSRSRHAARLGLKHSLAAKSVRVTVRDSFALRWTLIPIAPPQPLFNKEDRGIF